MRNAPYVHLRLDSILKLCQTFRIGMHSYLVGIKAYILASSFIFVTSSCVCHIDPDKEFYERKIVIIFLPINSNMCFCVLKRTVSLRRFF